MPYAKGLAEAKAAAEERRAAVQPQREAAEAAEIAAWHAEQKAVIAERALAVLEASQAAPEGDVPPEVWLAEATQERDAAVTEKADAVAALDVAREAHADAVKVEQDKGPIVEPIVEVEVPFDG